MVFQQSIVKFIVLRSFALCKRKKKMLNYITTFGHTVTGLAATCSHSTHPVAQKLKGTSEKKLIQT